MSMSSQVPFDTGIAHQVNAETGEMEELNVEETVRTVREEIRDAKFDAGDQIDNLLKEVEWSMNVEEQLLIIFEGLVRDVALVANEVENEVIAAQRVVKKADHAILSDLDTHFEKLGDVRAAVDDVKANFDQASEGAVRIGERLVASENERRRIEMAVDLLNHISWFEKAAPALFSDLQAKSAQELREMLPSNLQRKPFGEISQIVSDLRKVLFDINSTDVQNAQKNVTLLTEALEARFLSEFESAVVDLMDDPGNLTLTETCKNLAVWLHSYQGGASLHKRFIQCVMEKSIPRPSIDSMPESMEGQTSAWSKISSGVRAIGNKIKDGVKDGVNIVKDGVNALTNKENEDNFDGGAGDEGYNAQDSLSELFGKIGGICQQQFQLIRDVFPQNVVAKVTRMLIQRIFKDSAFGIQTRVDEVLNPKPPLPQMPLPDYLDALANVREKLSALYVILLEFCSHPALMGLGSESTMTRSLNIPIVPPAGKSFSFDAMAAASTLGSSVPDAAKGGAVPSSAADAILDEINEKIKNDKEVKAFLEEQIMGVLSSYMADYFDKEMAHLRNQYVDGLRRVVDDDKGPSKVSSGTVMQLPRFRAEKMKSIPALVKTVANNYYVSNVVSVTTDSVMRMENIGRDDKKLPARIKEIYLLQLGFLIEGVFYPYIQSCTTMLLRSAVAAPKNSVLPPLEYIQALAAVYAGVSLLKKNFGDVFMSSMASLPNLVVVCREARRSALKPLEHAAKESMHSWTMCVILHMERTLTAMQSSTDFNPSRGEGRHNAIGEQTPASEIVCQSFMKVVSTVQAYNSDLVGIDLVETFWRPLGQQFVGTLLVHLRKQKISQDGAASLMADLDEYLTIAQCMQTPDTVDMITCLKEIAAVYAAPPESVAKLVVENLRHLDTVIVLALVKARSDFTTRTSISHWTKKLRYVNTLKTGPPMVCSLIFPATVSLTPFPHLNLLCRTVKRMVSPSGIKLFSGKRRSRLAS